MKRILLPAARAALIVGALDIAAAMLKYYLSTGKDPVTVLRYIASGALGNEAFSGGALTAFYGLNFHFTIAFWWSIIYFILYPKFPLLDLNTYLSGTAYGIFVWCGMNLIVLPLSRVPQRPFDPADAAIGIIILIACIGIPIAVMAKKHFSQKEA